MKKGFTLIELLVVIMIITVLVLITVSSFSNFHEDYENANYIIQTDNGRYYVESYTKEHDGTCVYMSEKEVRFCGDWSVEKINQDN